MKWSPWIGLALVLSSVHGAEPRGDVRFDIGPVTFEQVEHQDALTGPNDHFGCLLYDAEGKLARHGEADAATWLYTGALVDGRWVSFVRRFDLETRKVGPRAQILDVSPGDKWATIHLAIQVDGTLTVVFFSTGGTIRAAVAERPEGLYAVDEEFRIIPSQPWEAGCSLESDGGCVPIENTDAELRLWILYDTLARDNSGDNGWAEVCIHKRAKRVTLVRKHPQNPLALRLDGRVASRTGGNLDQTLRFGGKFPLFYLSKPDAKTYRMAVALGRDPLLRTIDENRELAGPLATEQVIEKFQFYEHAGQFCIIYDVSDRHGDWRTSLRRYRMIPK